MGITIGNVYPWGRSFDEYTRMFALTEEDLRRRIVGVADGPAAFNAEMARRGNPVTSCDPLYRFEAAEIRSRIEQTRDLLVNLAKKEANRFVWDRVGSPENLGRVRMAAMGDFLGDYERGRREGRYLDRSLPNLEFAEGSFDIALCSHFLLLYSHEFSLEFHVEAVVEMCRVAGEARVFPVLDMRGETSAHLSPIRKRLEELGLESGVEKVSYEFQRGGDQMLRVWRRGV
jgi:hypothetical protein